MSSPLLCRQGCIELPPRLFPDPAYYALMAAYPEAAIHTGARFDKRTKAVHRYRIADVRGPLELTVPIVKPSGAATPQGVRWQEVGVSAHGRWWEVHTVALESAYGRTPFFEHYWPRLAPLFREPEPGLTVGDFIMQANAAVCSILNIETNVRANPAPGFTAPLPADTAFAEYWQVRADSLGFIPGLSILDLIFNLGPEAQLYLAQLPIAELPA